MVCTKQTYNVASGWSAAQLASAFRSAFIDAGLMTDWFDSFVNTSIENRILKITYDNTKTYGSVYYWFMFTTGGAHLHIATGWDAVAHVPTGTQYLDYYATSTNSTGNHWQMRLLTTGSAFDVIRYTSGIDANQSWFCIKQGTTRRAFTVFKGGTQVQDWIDLNKGYISGLYYTLPSTNNFIGLMSFGSGPILRRELVKGQGLIATTNAALYAGSSTDDSSIGYAAIGQFSTNSQNLNFDISSPWIFLPIGFSAVNPAYTANSTPVFHGLPISAYFKHALPSDIGLTFHYATNTFLVGDTLVVTAGAEEWEVLDFTASGTAVTGASPLFLARVV